MFFLFQLLWCPPNSFSNQWHLTSVSCYTCNTYLSVSPYVCFEHILSQQTCTCLNLIRFAIEWHTKELLKKLIISLSAPISYGSSSKCGIFWDFSYPHWHGNWCCHISLTEDPYCWNFMSAASMQCLEENI